MSRTNPILAYVMMGIFLMTAVAPASMAYDVAMLDALLLRVYMLDRSRESPAVAVGAISCVVIVAVRALTGVYFVTPIAVWHAAHAMISR